MKQPYARLLQSIAAVLLFSTCAFAAPLDDYYLKQFGEVKSVQLQKAILSVSPESPEAARCGMPLKHGLRRDWNLLEQSTQKVLAKQLALPTLLTEKTFNSAGGHFRVHYATSAPSDPNVPDDRPPLADLDNNGIPDWVETVGATFENVYASYSALGYQTAPTKPTGTPYDIYLRDLAPQGFYGVTTSDQPASSATYPNAFSSWMELDNNFTDSIYRPGTYIPLQSLQITAAHEYHHAVQYGYTYFFDVWYAEATSTWMEDELYDSVNQLYSYVPAWLANSTKSLDLAVGSDAVSSGAGYGRWIFNRYLSENRGPAMIRAVWEKVGGLARPDTNTDIPMVPVLESVLSSSTYGSSLNNDFYTFAKRVYTRDWGTHTSEISKIHTYSPVSTYSAYPVNSQTLPAATVTLPHYSFAYYKFIPIPGMSSLTITVANSSGIRTAAFRNRLGIITEIVANAGGNSYTDNAFSSSDEVVLLIANTTSADNSQCNFSTDGTASLAAPTSGSSSGGGCFIATAAYGSYLHPQVQLLRNFRDQYLLTNAPGRAFVALYYRCSPPLADFIARHTVLRSVSRLLLTPLVIAVAYPVISAVFMLLLSGAIFVTQVRRIKTSRSNARHGIIHTISSRF